MDPGSTVSGRGRRGASRLGAFGGGAASGTNERDLSLERDVSGGNERVATYPVDKLPTADDKETVPLDFRALGFAYDTNQPQ